MSTAADNAPSLWSGGVRWGDPAQAFGDGTDAYWGAPAAASGRTGKPRLSVAIAGGLVTEQLRAASWTLGRPDWLSTLTPTSASFTFVDKPEVHVNDPIVVGLRSDTTEYHSDALWVGRVTGFRTRRDLGDIVTTTITATDVIGVLGQAEAPTSLAAGYTLKTLIEQLALDAGVSLQVDTDPLVTLPTLIAASDISGKLLELVNRAERSSNALLFLRGNGRLYAAMRNSTGASAVTVVNLDGDDSASGWEEDTNLGNVVTRWKLGNDTWSTDTDATTLEEYGEQAFSATDLLVNDPAPYANLIASDVMANPRAVLVDAPFPVTDMGQKVLYLNPLDRVISDGTTWQVMSVQHDVSPAEWRMNITADATQEALVGAAEPGPVTPPALNTETLVLTSSKAGTWSLTSGGSGSATGLGDLKVGKDSSGTKHRSSVEWDISWPMNSIRVVSATVRLVTAEATVDPRFYIQRHTESWTEGGGSWGGPASTATGRRAVDGKPGTGKVVEASITSIAQEWLTSGDNYGVALRSVNEDSPSRYAVFASDESSETTIRPILTIVVEVVS